VAGLRKVRDGSGKCVAGRERRSKGERPSACVLSLRWRTKQQIQQRDGVTGRMLKVNDCLDRVSALVKILLTDLSSTAEIAALQFREEGFLHVSWRR
jgi:hypothetical protein